MILPILLTAYFEMDGIRVAQASETLHVERPPMWEKPVHLCNAVRTYRAADGTLVTWTDPTTTGLTERKWVRAGGGEFRLPVENVVR